MDSEPQIDVAPPAAAPARTPWWENPAYWLSHFEARGITFRLSGRELIANPKELLSADDRRTVKRFKAQLIGLLRLRRPPPPPPWEGPEPGVEVMFPDGLIAWKYAPPGEWDAGAAWWREKGAKVWRRIPGASCQRPPINPGFHLAECPQFEDDDGDDAEPVPADRD